MYTTLKIINKYFWKSLFGPGLIFLFGPLYLFIITSTWSLFGMIKSTAIIPSSMAMVITFLGMFCIPLTINTLRTSMVMKRLGSSKISPLTFLVCLIIYYWFFAIVCYVWMLGWGFLFYIDRIDEYLVIFNYMHPGDVLYSLCINYFLATTIGLIILVFTKRNYVIAVINCVVIIFSFALAGFAVPIPLIHISYKTDSGGWNCSPLTYIVYADPFWYSSSLSYESFFHVADDYFNLLGSSIFNPEVQLYGKTFAAQPTDGIVLGHADKYLNLILPIVIISSLMVVDIMTFKWNVR